MQGIMNKKSIFASKDKILTLEMQAKKNTYIKYVFLINKNNF